MEAEHLARTHVMRRVTLWWWVLAALAVVAGAWLRLQQFGTQIVIDDEWHALHKLLRADLLDTLTHLDYADYSIPITVYYRVLRDTIGVSEWTMHLPMLIAGLALVVIGPWLVREWTTPAVRATWAVLLAISPFLVYVSRTARPYALTALTGTIALVAFERWWRGSPHPQRWAIAYVAATFAGGYLHMTSLAFTLMPFVYFFVLSWRDAAAVKRLFKMGVATALPLLVAILPPVINDWFMFTAKAGVDSVTPATAYRTLFLLAGTGQGIVVALVVLCAVAGAWRLRRRDAVRTDYLLVTIVVGTLAIVAARPNWVQHPIVLARYLISVMPLVLLFAAEGLVAALPMRWPFARAAVVAAIAAIVVVTGPLPKLWSVPNQFTGHQRFQFDYDDANNPFVTELPDEPIPPFYRELARAPPGSLTLIEAPWRLESHYNPQVWYQQVHRQRVKIGMATPLCGVRDFGEYPEDTRGMRLANFEHVERLVRGEATDADFLVMHLKPWSTPAGQDVPWPDLAGCLTVIERALGGPVYRDERIVVFALPKLSR